MRAYLTFCRALNITPVPLSQNNLARYIAHLATKLSYCSIKQYINVIRIMHLEAGLPSPLGISWHVKSTLMSCKRVLGDTHRPKLPITIDLLKAIFSQLDLTEPMHVAFWAACLAAFFSFLRKSNMFVQGPGGPQALLRRQDVSFLPQGATLTIHHSKTIQNRERQLIIAIPHIPNSPLCPATALLLVHRLAPGSRARRCSSLLLPLPPGTQGAVVHWVSLPAKILSNPPGSRPHPLCRT